LSLPEPAPKELEARTSAALLDTYARTAFHPRKGKGARLVDADGKVYWDLLAGIAVNALGHRHPRLVKALKEEAGALLHVSNLFYHPAPTLLGERLVQASGLARAFFTNSGAEANETAVKLARLAQPGRSGLVALEHGFHGRTLGALSLTHHEPYRLPFAPLLPGVTWVPPNDISALERAVSAETSAIVMEPILGEAGILPLTPEFLSAARRVADAFGATLVFDEIQCGLGRTGSLFAFQRFGIAPDVLTLAKPLGGGLPLGAVVVNERVAAAIKPGQHGTTFGGNPVACRLGLEALDEIVRLLPKIAALGAFFEKRLAALKKTVPAIVDVRGCGLIWGIELDREAGPVAKELLQRGFVVGTAKKNVLRLLPPYVVPRSALAAFALELENVLTKPSEVKS
jgi:predicted acetylornithine/succinylornithine family transaminase